MKKVILVFFGFMLFFFLSACSNPAAQNFGDFVEGYESYADPVEGAFVYEPATIVSHEDADFHDELGFAVASYPNSGTYTVQKYYRIDWYGQLEYEVNGRSLVLRAASVQRDPLRKRYEESHSLNAEEKVIDGITVSVGESNRGCMLATWERDSFQYSLHTYKDGGITQEELELFVENTSCTA